MRNQDVWKVILFFFMTAAVIVPTAALVLDDKSLSGDILMTAVLFAAALVALWGYLWNRRNDLAVVSEKNRESFLTNEVYGHVRMLIEHNDLTLQTLVAILNTSDPYQPGLIPVRYQGLHEKLDQYLGFLEGIAVLLRTKTISRESFVNIWAYYLERLRDVSIPIKPQAESAEHLREGLGTIYEGSAPDHVERALDDAVQGKGYHVHYDPVDGSPIDPIRKPIWYYIHNLDNLFVSTTQTVTEAVCSRRNEKRGLPVRQRVPD